MAARDILKNFAAFVDGRGYAGEVTEYNPPDLALLTEDFRGGGMDGPLAIEMGMEALETSFSMSKYDDDVLRLWGVTQGGNVPFIVRGAIESFDGTVAAIAHTMRGRIIRLARGSWTPGQLAPLQVTMRLHYYKEERGEVAINEIDIINMVRIVGGVDQLKAQRNALGI